MSSYKIGQTATTFIETQQDPFLLIIKYSNIDYIAQKYREGGELYSMAIKNCDRSIGLIIEALKKTGQWDRSEFLITTSYGYEPKSKQKSKNTWVISSKKILRKGSVQDIVPSLFDLANVEDQLSQSELVGESLFR